MALELEILGGIDTPCGTPNIAGIAKLEYLPIDWIESFPEFLSEFNEIINEISVIADKDWILMTAIQDTLEFKEEQTDSNQTEYFTASVNGSVSMDTTSTNAQLNLMRRLKFILKYTDKNGNIKIVGTPDFPLSFSSGTSTGSNSTQLNGYSFIFKGKIKEKSPFYVI